MKIIIAISKVCSVSIENDILKILFTLVNFKEIKIFEDPLEKDYLI